MNVKDELGDIKCFGSTTVGPRGQVVIPVSARKELGVEAGDTLLVFKTFHGRGVLLLKVDAVEQMLGMVSERLASFDKLVKDYRSPKTAAKKKRTD